MIKSLSMMPNSTEICAKHRRKMYGKDAKATDYRDSFIINECINNFNAKPDSLMNPEITKLDQAQPKMPKSVNLRSDCYSKLHNYSAILNLTESEVCRRILFYYMLDSTKGKSDNTVQITALKSKVVLLQSQIENCKQILDQIMNEIELHENKQSITNILYINVNGFYGTQNKDKEKLLNGIDDDCCKKNAERICKKILETKYDIIYLAEFAPNTPTGEWVTKLLDQNGYNRILPNSQKILAKKYYSIVCAFAKKELGITQSVKSPNNWLKWCEIVVNNHHVVGVHSPNTEFLNDTKYAVEHNKQKDLTIVGDVNVTEASDEESQKLINEIINLIGAELLDVNNKNTYRKITKPDRVFSNCDNIEFIVLDGFFDANLSDHDALCITLK